MKRLLAFVSVVAPALVISILTHGLPMIGLLLLGFVNLLNPAALLLVLLVAGLTPILVIGIVIG